MKINAQSPLDQASLFFASYLFVLRTQELKGTIPFLENQGHVSFLWSFPFPVFFLLLHHSHWFLLNHTVKLILKFVWDTFKKCIVRNILR